MVVHSPNCCNVIVLQRKGYIYDLFESKLRVRKDMMPSRLTFGVVGRIGLVY